MHTLRLGYSTAHTKVYTCAYFGSFKIKMILVLWSTENSHDLKWPRKYVDVYAYAKQHNTWYPVQTQIRYDY